VGDVIGINGYRVNRAALKQRFTEGGYQPHQTAHFLLFTRAETPATVIVHWFAPEVMNADVGDYIIQELKPLGILKEAQDFSDVFGAVVGSLFPYNVEQAWYVYGTNTLGRYQELLKEQVYMDDHEDSFHSLHLPHHYGTFASNDEESPHSTIEVFASLYRRVYELLVGQSFLDAGCSFGFLPLLVAEQFPVLSHVVGVDIRPEPFTTMRRIAHERGLGNVQYIQADLLSDDFHTIGNFDTVTALHLLEHFTEEDMYRVLGNLLKVTARRLIIAVPYEQDEPEALYGHEQLFSRAKLKAVGQWCLEQWGSRSGMWCEECEGGLLVVDRSADEDGIP